MGAFFVLPVVWLCKILKVNIGYPIVEGFSNGFFMLFPLYWFMSEAPWYYTGCFGRLPGAVVQICVFLLSAYLFSEIIRDKRLVKVGESAFFIMLCALVGFHIRDNLSVLTLCVLFVLGMITGKAVCLKHGRLMGVILCIVCAAVMGISAAAVITVPKSQQFTSSGIMSIFGGCSVAFALGAKEQKRHILFGFCLAFFLLACL